MRKATLPIALATSVALNVYLMIDRPEPVQVSAKIVEDFEVDSIKTKQAAVKKQINPSGKDSAVSKKPDKTNRPVSEIVESPTLYTGLPTEEELVESQERWRENVSDFFVANLDLRESDVDKYFDIKNSRDRELSKFLTERIKNQGSFIYTLEDMVDENKINERYLNKLKNLMGDQGYKDYKAFRDQHNREMIENQQTHSLIEL